MITNKSVTDVIEVWNKKVLELKKIYPKHELLPRLMKFSKTTISTWFEHWMDKKEENYDYNEKVTNEMLDWINKLNDILKNKSENIMKKSQLKTLLKEIIKEISRGRVRSGGNELENYEIELESLAIPGISSENQGATITVNIEYDADPGQPAFGMGGPPEFSEPSIEPSVEITNASVVGVKVYDENGENEFVVDLHKLTPEQLRVVTNAANLYVDKNRQRIESEILDSVDTEPDYPDDRDER